VEATGTAALVAAEGSGCRQDASKTSADTTAANGTRASREENGTRIEDRGSRIEDLIGCLNDFDALKF
jgi:hypothetical protein